MPGNTDVLGELLVLITGETKQYDKSIDASKKKTEKFQASLKKFGNTLTKSVTLPLVALAVASTKFASDLGESINAVNVVYGESADIIKDWGNVAAEQAGLSKAAFNESSALIGTLLKKTGQDLDGVATDTITLTKRSADLASVFNKDLSIATTAVGAALRGETEPIRQFAIDVSAAAVEAEALSSGLIKNKSELTEAVKVQVRYNLILKQSQNVAGDFVNTNDELANSTRVLKADLENAAAELGQAFLPIAKDLVSTARDSVQGFNDLSDGTKKVIIGVAGLAAGLGPAIKGVTALKVAFTTLSGPIGLALAAVTGLVAGIAKLKADAAEPFKELAESTGVTADNLRQISDISTGIIVKADTLAEGFDIAQKNSGLTKKELVEVLKISGNLTFLQEQYLLSLTKTAKTSQELIALSNMQAKALEAVNKEAADLSETQLKSYVDQNEAVQQILEAHKSEIEAIDEQIAFINKLGLAAGKFSDDQLKATEQLQADKKAILDAEAKDIEAAILSEAQARRDFDIETLNILKAAREEKQKIRDQELEDEKEKFDNMIDLANQFVDIGLGIASSLLKISLNKSNEELRILNEQLAEEIEINKQALQDAIDRNDKELESDLQLSADKLALKLEELNIETQAEQDLATFKDELDQQRRETEISDTEARISELLATGELEDAEEARRLQVKLDNDATLRELEENAKIDTEQRIKDITAAEEAAEAERLGISEKAKTEKDRLENEAADEKLRIEKDLANKKYDIELAQFKATQALSLADAIVTTARGVAASIPNVPLMIASGLAGAFQIGVIASQKAPSKPQLNTGAIALGSNRGVDVTVGENNQGEIIQGMGSRGAALRKQLAQENAKETAKLLGGRSGGIIVNIYGRTMTTKRDLEDFAIKLRPALVKADQRVGVS